MRVLDVECTENPVNIKKFDVINNDEFPLVLLGVEIKNEYDQQRFVFNKKYNIKNIVHFVNKPAPCTKFFRGITIKLNLDITKLLQKINLHKESLSNIIPQAMYKNILKEYNLTCENSISYLSEDIYPIDGECISQITSDISLTEQYEYMFDNKKIPYYQSVGYMSIFIIDNNNYDDNKKTFKKLLHIEKNSFIKH